MQTVSPTTVPASLPAGNPLDPVAAEVADLTSTLTAELGRAPVASELMLLNLRRNGERKGLSSLRKAVDNALLLMQNAEIDARLDTLTTSEDRAALFHTIYPLTLAERIRAEQRQRAEAIRQGRVL